MVSLRIGISLTAPRPSGGGGGGAVPNGAITINSKPVTINGKYITIGV